LKLWRSGHRAEPAGSFDGPPVIPSDTFVSRRPSECIPGVQRSSWGRGKGPWFLPSSRAGTSFERSKIFRSGLRMPIPGLETRRADERSRNVIDGPRGREMCSNSPPGSPVRGLSQLLPMTLCGVRKRGLEGGRRPSQWPSPATHGRAMPGNRVLNERRWNLRLNQRNGKREGSASSTTMYWRARTRRSPMPQKTILECPLDSTRARRGSSHAPGFVPSRTWPGAGPRGRAPRSGLWSQARPRLESGCVSV
jgi:hypothetical protein